MKRVRRFLTTFIGIFFVLHSTKTFEKDSPIFRQFATYDETDQFYFVTQTTTKLLASCDNLGIKFFGIITDITQYARWFKGFMHKFGFIKVKYTILGDVKVFPTTTRTPQVYHTKLDAFLVVAESVGNLEYMLHRLRTTKWWSNEGLSFFIDGRTMSANCQNAQSFLNLSWNVNLLSSFFVCLETEDRLSIYTYNPYADRAPRSWNKVHIPNHRAAQQNWTLYSRTLIPGKTTCEDLHFDKTLRLDGFEYRAVGVPLPPAMTVNTEASGKTFYGGLDTKIHKTFADVLNASFSPKIVLDGELGWVEPSGVAHHLLANVSAGDYDVLMNSVYVFNKFHATMTYPHLESGLAILSRFAGMETEQAKILKFMNPILVGGVAVVAVLTVLVLGVLYRYGLTQAALEVMRLVTNTTMIRPISNAPLRVYVLPVTFLFLITNAAFQCNLAAILTNPVPKPNVEDAESLKDFGYTIYAGMEYFGVIDDPIIRSRIHLLPDWNCSKHVAMEENVVCAADRYELMKITIDGSKLNFYLSSNNIVSLSSAYVARPDWPLRNRLNVVISRLFESGILDLWKRQDAEIFVQNWKMYSLWYKDRTPRKMNVDNVAFAFVWLIVGLLSSLLAFFAEHASAYYQIRRKRRVRFPFVQ